MVTVLIVDDEPAVVQTLRLQLTDVAFAAQAVIEGALSASEALDLLDQLSAPLAVVIADYLMPGMRGDDLLIEIHQRVPQARLILLTGQAEAHNVGKIVNQAKLFRYIAKPWDVLDLQLTLREALQAYQQEKLIQRHEYLRHVLLEYLQAILRIERLDELARFTQHFFKERLDLPLASPPWNGPPPVVQPNPDPPLSETLAILTQNYVLREAHLRLIEELERLVEQRTAHLVELNQELLALQSQKEAWVKRVSHDLRGPLSGLKQLAHLLQGSQLSQDKLQKYAAMLEQSLSELERYVQNLLDLTRLSQRDVVFEKAPLNWESLGCQLVGLLRPQAEAKGVSLYLDAPASQGWGDPVYLTQALFNLLSNAIKYTPSGKAVRLRITSYPDHDELVVTDEGIGMTPEELERLWTPHKQRIRPGTAGEKGTGLGLPIVKAIIEGHGGRIAVESTPSRGTTFRLYLPKNG